MDWDLILGLAGVPDSPGRAEAVQKAVSRSVDKKAKKQANKGKR